jgi:hypothetical protein
MLFVLNSVLVNRNDDGWRNKQKLEQLFDSSKSHMIKLLQNRLVAVDWKPELNAEMYVRVEQTLHCLVHSDVLFVSKICSKYRS